MDVEAFSRVGAVSDTMIDMMASSALWWMSDEPVTEMMRGESFVMVAIVRRGSGGVAEDNIFWANANCMYK